MNEPEPRLELTVEEWKWVRAQRTDIKECERERGITCRCMVCQEKQELIDFLFRVEAGRQQAAFAGVHNIDDPEDCRECECTNEDAGHYRTPADWLAKVREEKLRG